MDTPRLMLAGVALVTISGCAVMDPYIRHSKIRNDQQYLCANVAPPRDMNAHKDWALDYACSMVIRLERARSQITRTRSGLTAALFPIGGIVAYNTARGFNAPTNIALTSGGLAAYSAVSTLAQPDRVRIYDNGLRATTCAIGVYRQAISHKKPQSLNQILLDQSLRQAAEDLIGARSAFSDNPKELAQLRSISEVLEGIHQSLRESGPDRVIQAQLEASVGNTIAEVNAQLTQTMPTNSESNDAVISMLQTTQDAPKPNVSAVRSLLASPMNSLLSSTIVKPDKQALGQSSLNSLNNKLGVILDLFDAVQDENIPQLTADFSACKYASIDDIATQLPTSKLLLGAADSLNNQTANLAKGETFEARIYGGLPPYNVQYLGPAKPSGADFEIVSSDGASHLRVTAPAASPSDELTYKVSVTDSAGRYAKYLNVVFNTN